MRSVGWAIAWDVWGRHRLVLGIGLVYLVVLLVLFHAVPVGLFTTSGDDPKVVPLGLGLSLPLVYVFLHVLLAFTLSESAQLEARESGYPRRSFTLPVRTAALVGWPFALGASVLALLWLALAGLLWRRCGVRVPLWWPVPFLAAFLTWLQALLWWPFPLPFLRIAFVVPILIGLAAAAVVGHAEEVPEWLLLTGYTALIVPGHWLARAGVGRARRGDGTTVGAVKLAMPRANRGVVTAVPFSSPARALFWLTWRRSGFILPLQAGLLTLFLVALMLVITWAYPNPEVYDAPAEVVKLGVIALLSPIFMASLVSMPFAARGTALPPELRLPAFVGARPVPTAAIIAALWRVAIVSVLTTYLLVVLLLLVALPFIHVTSRLTPAVGSLVDLGVKGWVILGLMVVGLPALTWKQMIGGMWVPLAGRRWVGRSLALATVVGYTALALFGGWVYTSSEWHDTLRAAVPWAVGAALFVKVLAGLVVVRALRRRRLVADRTVIGFAVVWLSVAAGIVALAFWLTPTALGTPWLIGGGAVLLTLPLVRPSLAPLALDVNRHR